MDACRHTLCTCTYTHPHRPIQSHTHTYTHTHSGSECVIFYGRSSKQGPDGEGDMVFIMPAEWDKSIEQKEVENQIS